MHNYIGVNTNYNISYADINKCYILLIGCSKLYGKHVEYILLAF